MFKTHNVKCSKKHNVKYAEDIILTVQPTQHSNLDMVHKMSISRLFPSKCTHGYIRDEYRYI